MENIIASVDLECTEGSSNKTYLIRLVEVAPAAYQVKFEFGAIGSVLKQGTKTPTPVGRAEAEKVFAKLEREKRFGKEKAYRVVARTPPEAGAEASAAATDTATAGEEAEREVVGVMAATVAASSSSSASFTPPPPAPTGFRPQLLNTVTDDDAARLLTDADFVMQQKVDGQRLLLAARPDGVITASNKLGRGVVPPPTLKAAFARWMQLMPSMRAGVCVDGEYADGVFYIFDVHLAQGISCEHLAYTQRAQLLGEMFASVTDSEITTHIRLLETAYTTEEKHALAVALRAGGAEGAVFKRAAAELVAGRPASGGDQLKWKFVKTVDAMVRPNPARRSLECFVFNRVGQPIDIGGVASGVTQEIYDTVREREGGGRITVAELRYLYLTADVEAGGQLYQAAFVRLRDDKPMNECHAAQLETTSKAVHTFAAGN